MAQLKLKLTTASPITVATSGTRVPLSATSLKVSYLMIQRDPSNAGNIYLGDSTVTASNGIVVGSSSPSIAMSADDTEADEDKGYFDLADMYIDAANNGDKVRIAYIALESLQY